MKKIWNKGLTKEIDERVKRYSEKRMGKNHPLYKGRGKTSGGGYYILIVEDTDLHRRGERIYEHRYIMEKILGRRLKSYEEVHHRNSIPDDNRPENLEIVLKKAHFGNVNCSYCQKTFKIK